MGAMKDLHVRAGESGLGDLLAVLGLMSKDYDLLPDGDAVSLALGSESDAQLAIVSCWQGSYFANVFTREQWEARAGGEFLADDATLGELLEALRDTGFIG